MVRIIHVGTGPPPHAPTRAVVAAHEHDARHGFGHISAPISPIFPAQLTGHRREGQTARSPTARVCEPSVSCAQNCFRVWSFGLCGKSLAGVGDLTSVWGGRMVFGIGIGAVVVQGVAKRYAPPSSGHTVRRHAERRDALWRLRQRMFVPILRIGDTQAEGGAMTSRRGITWP